MTERMEVYRCEICGNVVEVLHDGIGELVCCGQPMTLMEAKTEDQGREKHVPVVESGPSGMTVKVGSVPHPMEEAHHIEWIEVLTAEGVVRATLSPGVAPEAVLEVRGDVVEVRAYCNVHGLWRARQ